MSTLLWLASFLWATIMMRKQDPVVGGACFRILAVLQFVVVVADTSRQCPTSKLYCTTLGTGDKSFSSSASQHAGSNFWPQRADYVIAVFEKQHRIGHQGKFGVEKSLHHVLFFISCFGCFSCCFSSLLIVSVEF